MDTKIRKMIQKDSREQKYDECIENQIIGKKGDKKMLEAYKIICTPID